MKRFILRILLFILNIQIILFPQSPVVQQILDSVNLDSLSYFVGELSGEIPTIVDGTLQTISSRHKDHLGNHLAETYLKQKMQSYGLPTTIQSCLPYSTTAKNVLATQVGTQFPNKKYIICAHYDDFTFDIIAPGADDNASGTAAVIESARIFSQHSFPFTTVYALWDEEEQGIIGSSYYATQATNVGDSILGVINMDMIAYDSNDDGICNVHNRDVGSSTQLYNKMLEVNTQYEINLNMVSYDPGYTFSDHASFWEKGFGAILLIEDENDFNKYYHSVNDLLQYFNKSYFVKSVKLALATLASLAMNLNLDIFHTPIASMITPQIVKANSLISTDLPIDSGTLAPRLYYRTRQGAESFGLFTEVIGIPVGNGSYDFTLPALVLGSVVQYYIAVQDSNGNISKTLPLGGSGFNPPGNIPPKIFFQFYVADLAFVMSDDANSLDSWTSSGGWNITSEKYVSAPFSFTDSPIGNYISHANASLKYNNQIDLVNVLGASLEYDAQWDIQSHLDYGQVQISTNNGITWIPLAGQYTKLGTGAFQPNGKPLYDGIQSSWIHEVIDISSFTNYPISLRFLLRSDRTGNQDGWYIDNIKISFYSDAVPVELSSFTASANSKEVTLNWSTATELNNQGFEVQRKFGDNSFATIGSVKGHGTTTSPYNYTYVDKLTDAGKYFYRLKQIDYGGKYEYLQTVEINWSPFTSYKLEQNYPNPFNPTTKISFAIPLFGGARGGSVTLKVYDVLGNEVRTLIIEGMAAGYHSVDFTATNLPSGVYFYQLRAGAFVETRKMILLR
jgi:hypothetical protein